MASLKGLGPLAEAILADRAAQPEVLAAGYLGAEVADVKEALSGARDILVEGLAEDADLLGRLRDFLRRTALLTARVVGGQEEKGAKFSDYFDHSESWAKAPSHRALAMMRGANEGVLTLDITPESEAGVAEIEAMIGGALGIGGGAPGDLWLAGVAIWIVGHALGVLAARHDPDFVEVARRHLRLPALLDV